MVVPPKKWTFVANGGYLTLHTKIMRHRDSSWQLQCVKRGKMDELLTSLNKLSDIPWVINKEVLNVIMQVWNTGGGFGDLPPRKDIAIPEFDPFKYETDEQRIEAERIHAKTVKKVLNMFLFIYCNLIKPQKTISNILGFKLLLQ